MFCIVVLFIYFFVVFKKWKKNPPSVWLFIGKLKNLHVFLYYFIFLYHTLSMIPYWYLIWKKNILTLLYGNLNCSNYKALKCSTFKFFFYFFFFFQNLLGIKEYYMVQFFLASTIPVQWSMNPNCWEQITFCFSMFEITNS